MAYTLSEIDVIVTKLESSLAKGFAEVSHEGQRLVYKSTADILRAIGYFQGLRNSASDAPAKVDTRTFFLYGGGR